MFGSEDRIVCLNILLRRVLWFFHFDRPLNFHLFTLKIDLFFDQKAIQHPVVRMLIMRKWNKFGHWWFW